MIIFALAAGIITCVLFAVVVGPVSYGDPFEAFLPAAVAGLWVFWGFVLFIGLRRLSLLHPPPRSYRIGVEEAAGAISAYLDEGVRMYGEPWRRIGYWPESGRLSYEMIWVDNVVKEKSGHFIKVDQTPERLFRRVVLELAVHEKAPGFTVVRLDWDAEAEGSYETADHLIRITTRDIFARLGSGMTVPERALPIVEPPPWWLLAATTAMLVMSGLGIKTQLAELGRQESEMSATMGDIKLRLDDEVAATRSELAQWAKFKKANNIP